MLEEKSFAIVLHMRTELHATKILPVSISNSKKIHFTEKNPIQLN
jgi:hypothetical protein